MFWEGILYRDTALAKNASSDPAIASVNLSVRKPSKVGWSSSLLICRRISQQVEKLNMMTESQGLGHTVNISYQ
jgi:hypothetical protein